MNPTTFTVTCQGCTWAADFPSEADADLAAQTHITLGREHRVICTRPPHASSAAPEIVFMYPQKEPEA